MWVRGLDWVIVKQLALGYQQVALLIKESFYKGQSGLPKSVKTQSGSREQETVEHKKLWPSLD